MLINFKTLARLQIFTDPQALIDDVNQNTANASSQLNDVRSRLDPLSQGAGRLQTIFFVIIGWIVLLTLALLIFGLFAYKRWRRQRAGSSADSVSITNSSTSQVGNLADFEKAVKGVAREVEKPGDTEPLPPPDFRNVRAAVTISKAWSTPSPLGSVSSVDEKRKVFRPPIHLSR